MTQRKNNRYYNINELIKDVEALGDWRDPSQLEAFSEVYYKMTNTGHACSSQKGMHYYPIDVFNAMHDVSSKKFPKQDGDLEIEATIFYGNIHDLAIKNHGAVSIYYISPLPFDKAEFDELSTSCKNYMAGHTPAPEEVVFDI